MKISSMVMCVKNNEFCLIDKTKSILKQNLNIYDKGNIKAILINI